jgi:polar amino acid transport system permease protein
VEKKQLYLDYRFFADHFGEYVEAAVLTLRIGSIGILFSLILGFFCALVIYYKIPILKHIIQGYVELSRNTPLLIQLFLLYFGLPKIGIMFTSEQCGIIGLTFLGGSYMTEAFRSGLESVDKVQIEAGLCIGLTKSQNVRYVILPQALAVSVPPLIANVIFLIKETSVFSAVALADLMFVAKDLIGMYYATDEALLLLVFFYAIILLPISIVASLLERRLRRAGFGH